uniref:Uncharacterized protein n=1 Tax=Arundo donax TaxID=35708 RepID=A0A0A9BUT4_ARUDO
MLGGSDLEVGGGGRRGGWVGNREV